jgi:CRP-like cAMP-binding protein
MSHLMHTKPDLAAANVLLATLSDARRARLLKTAERVEYAIGTVVTGSEALITHVYFPETALLSLLCVLPDRSAVETAVVGREGMAPLAPFHGVDRTPEQVVVQGAGTLLRVDVDEFMEIVDNEPRLRIALHRYSQALYTFAAQSSACNRMHTVTQRCARWLLATHDRIAADEFAMTHLFLSQMVGVRRSSVTLAAEALRDAGAIDYARGKIRIVNRRILREQACDCYEIVREIYERLIGGVSGSTLLAGVRLAEDGKSATHAGDPEAHYGSRKGESIEDASSNGATDLKALAMTIDEAIHRLRDAQAAIKEIR